VLEWTAVEEAKGECGSYSTGDEIELKSVGVTVAINDLYFGVNFEI
jgi:hypothetical protein